MSWQSMIMAPSEFFEFRRNLKSEYLEEIAAGRLAGYTLFARKRDAGDQLLLVPPGAVVLFERLPRWRKRLRPYKGMLDLKGFEAVPMH